MIFIFAGTSGSGRKTIAQKVCKELGICKIVSYTTRPPRPHEEMGVDYNFTSDEQFIADEAAGQFFQTTEIDKALYGIKLNDLNAAVEKGHHAYVIVNRTGASKLKHEFKDKAVQLFIYVDKNTIKERLEAHGEDYERIEHYLNHYSEEVTYRKECEHIFENLNLIQTIASVKKTIEEIIKPV